MNRNWLKLIAVISMLIDHVGAFLLPSHFWMRLVGRLAFPIFAFFIAEGMRYTKSRKKYVLTLLVFAIISQVPYVLLMNWYNLNILFSFLIAILVIYLLETYKTNEILKMVSLIVIFSVLLLVELFNIIDYGIFGILLVVVFYFIKDRKLALCIGACVLALLSLKGMLLAGFTLRSLNQLLSLLSLLFIAFYNGEKGRACLKYFFYVFYPIHLALIAVVNLMI